VTLERAEQMDLDDGASPVNGGPPLALDLQPEGEPVERVQVRFLSPTELKSGGTVVARPEFAVLFARLRDRIATLRTLYGAGPLEIDFRRMGERAAAVRMSRCEVHWEKVERKSGRTGQMHPLGGFTGEAEYQGELAEFLPWLRAARWVGVGRQTVWGKGDVRVV
jgi:CRISPR/Cas system endoribonuclease Cas6 (RAMP superfamily)